MPHLGFHPASDQGPSGRRPPEHGSIYLDVAPVAGASIEVVCGEAVGLAKRLNVGVRFRFNGVSATAWATDAESDVVDRWRASFGIT